MEITKRMKVSVHGPGGPAAAEQLPDLRDADL